MAKKENFETDDFDFDNEMEMPDFDFESTETKDDRKPVGKFAESFVGSVKQQMISPEFVTRTIKSSLPRGYGSAIDVAGQSLDSMRNLYNTSAKEIKPVINEIKKTTKKITKAADAALPRSVADRLNKWADTADKERSGDISQEQQRDNSIQMQLGEIFKTQLEQGFKDKADQTAKDNLKEGINQVRHRDQLFQLDSMRVSLKKLTEYQDNILANYHRKSLELQYRHYFVAMDMLEEQKKFTAISETHLAGIVKNTALPEFVKLRQSEAFKEATRNKFLDTLNDGIFEKRRNFIKNVGSNVSSAVMDRVKGFAESVRTGLSTADMLLDQQEMMAEMSASMGGAGPGLNPASMAGDIAGSLAADNIGQRLGRFGRKQLNKMPKVLKYGNKAGFIANNAAQYGREFAEEGDDAGFFGGLKNFGRDVIRRSLTGPSGAINNDSLDNIQDPSPFNRQNSKTINEIIPGYLAHIHREIKVLRTGDESTGLMSFDLTSNKFSSAKSVAKNVFDRVINKSDREYNREELKGLIDKLDPEGTELSVEERKALGKFLLDQNLDNRLGSAKRFTSVDTFTGGAGAHADKFASLFSNYYGEDSDSSKEASFASDYNRLGAGVSDARKSIQELVNAGYGGILQEQGILKSNGSVDFQKYYDYNYGEDAPVSATDTAMPGRRKVSRRRGESPGASVNTSQHRGFRYGTDAAAGFVTPPPAPSASAQATVTNADMSGVIETITQHSVKSVSDIMSETLLRIEQRINSGLLVFNAGGGGGNGEDGDGVAWYNQTVGQNLSAMGRFGKKQLTNIRDKARSISGKVFGAANTARQAIQSAGSSLFNKAKEKLNEFSAVYVEGEIAPRLLAWKLKAGQYRDQATNKIITSLKDIRGAVIDENGEVVLGLEDLNKIFIKSRLGKAVKDVFGFVKGTFDNIKNKVTALIPPVFRFGAESVKSLLKATLNRPADVYVKGKDNPVLLAVTMRAGGYFSKLTGKAIEHPGQIDGVVIDSNGEVKLSEEDLAKGLTDINGEPLTSGIGKVFGAAKKILKAGAGLFTKAKNAVKGMVSGVGDWFKNWVGPEGIIFSGSKDITERLKDIYELLDERMPGKKKILGDADGDGDRDGSYEDILQRRDNKQKSKAEKLMELAKNTSVGKGMGDLIGKMKSLFKKSEEDDEDDDSLLSDAADVANIVDGADRRRGGQSDRPSRRARARARRRARPRGRLGRLRQGAGSLWDKAKGFVGRGAVVAAPGAVGAAGAAGAAGTAAAGATGAAGLAGAAGAAGTAATGAGRSLLGRGASALGGLGMRGLGLAGAAYGGYNAYQDLKEGNYGSAAMNAGLTGVGLLTSGATIGGMAGGLMTAGTALAAFLASPVVLGALAVGAVGAAGYYGYKYLTSKKLGQLSKVRYAQYGFAESDSDHLQAVFSLEDKLMPAVVWDGNRPSLDKDKINPDGILESFDISKENGNQTAAFIRWFDDRFKPIFMTNLAALKAASPGKSLGDVDSLKAEEKKSFFKIAKYTDGPYAYMISPFPNDKQLVMGNKEVNAMITAVQAEIDGEAGSKKPGDSKTPASVADSAPAAAVAASAAATATNQASNANVGSDSSTPKALSASQAAAGTSMTATGAFGGFTRTSSGRVPALTVVRYKTYGLNEMVLEKVRALDTLEEAVLKNISYTGDNKAMWSGDISSLINSIGSSFGVQGENNNAAYDWKAWFVSRFLPTFLNFMGGVKAGTGKNDIESSLTLKPHEQIDLAMAVYSTKTGEGMSSTVWLVKESPWPGYGLNPDPKSVEVNIQAMKELTNKMTLDEQKAKNTGSGMGSDNGADSVKGSQQKSMTERAWEATKSAFGTAGSSVSGWMGKAWDATKEVATNTISSVMGGTPDYSQSTMSGGGAITNHTSGSGGSINDLPGPNGPEGKWSSVKDLIVGAAKMVGVDERLMGTMAAIESGFKWSVKAGTSSATGLYQFIKSTWDTMLRKYGKKYGIDPKTLPSDPRANALMGAEFLKENAQGLAGAVKGRPLTDTDMYIAHFMGLGGARKFLTADPNGIGAQLMPAAAKANQSIYYKGKGLDSPRTVAEVYSEINRRVRSHGKKFGLDGGSEGIVTGAQKAPAGGSALMGPPTPTGSGDKATTGSTVPPVAPSSANAAGIIGPMPQSGAKTAPILSVTEVSPGVTVKTRAPKGYAGQGSSPAPISTGAASTISSAPDTSMGSIGGFTPQSQRAVNINAQNDYQQESLSKILGPVDTTLIKSLEVQKLQLDALVRIQELIANSGSKATPVTSSSKVQPKAPPTTMPNAPVSMTHS